MTSRKPEPSGIALNSETLETHLYYNPPKEICGETCPDCNDQFRSCVQQTAGSQVYLNAFSLDEATAITTAYAQNIKVNQIYLQRAIIKHGNTIVNRWKKKSRDKRATVLLKAFPKLFPTPLTKAHIEYDHCKGDDWKGWREFREVLLLPYLALETLRDDAFKFLGLLHARTAFDPEAWVTFDKQQMRGPWYFGAFGLEFAEGCVVLYGPNYGKVVPWNKDQAHCWNIAGFPRGRLILEAQNQLMGFLRRIVEDLLEGVEIESGSDKWNELVHTGFRRAIGVETWSPYSNQAFSAPIFDVNRLVDISRSRLQEAEDHLWLLQTDPAYFQITAKEEMQCRMWKGGNPEWSSKQSSWAIWDRATWIVISWGAVVRETQRLRAMYFKLRDSIYPGQPLPKRFEACIAGLELLLVNLLLERSDEFNKLLARSPGFEHLYSFQHQGKQINVKLNFKKTGTDGELFHKDRLFWCIAQFIGDIEGPVVYDPALVLAWLDDWLQKDSTTFKDKCRLDTKLLSRLSDLAVNHEMLAAVRQHRPVCKPAKKDDVRKCANSQVYRTIWGIDNKFKYSTEDWEIITADFNAVIDTPFPKGKQDAAWLQRANDAREKLSKYWTKAREIYLKRAQFNQYLTDEEIKGRIDCMSYDLAPEHLSILKIERKRILAAELAAKQKPKLSVVTTKLEWPSETESPVIIPQAPAPKLKTRGDATSFSASENEAESEALTDATATIPTPPVLSLKPGSVRVLTRLFPSTPEEYAAKPLDWKSFVGAMDDAGFPAAHSGGSAVTFAKEGEGRIVFHKPHPVAKVDQIMLQGWGKRLRKWFGWERESFVAEKK